MTGKKRDWASVLPPLPAAPPAAAEPQPPTAPPPPQGRPHWLGNQSVEEYLYRRAVQREFRRKPEPEEVDPLRALFWGSEEEEA